MIHHEMRLVVLSLLVVATACEREANDPPTEQARAPASTSAEGMCSEHGVPEALCTKCNPGLAAVFKAKGDWCEEHGFPESFCPICSPDAEFPDVGAAPARPASGTASFAPGTKVRFRTAETEATAGIETVAARKATIGSGVTCTARIDYNRNKLADIRALVPGVVRKLRVDLGQDVEKGAALFVLQSTQVGEAQARLPGLAQVVQTARANHQRKKALAADGLVAPRAVERAKQELAAAEAELASARSSVRLAGASAGRSGSYVLTSPLAGTVVRRPAVVGAYATADTSLGTVADTSTMWALFDVPEASVGAIRTGQSVSIVIDGGAEERLRGELTWIASEVDPKTRMVAARAEIANEHGTVRANQFARAVIETGSSTGAVMVPRAALQRFGDKTLLFVRLGEGLYEPRLVVPGPGDVEELQVTGDVKADEAVVTTGAYLLKTELSPESIGAGCCDVEAPEAG